MTPAIVIGADGLIGQALMAELQRRGWNVVGTTRKAGSPGARPQLDLARVPPRVADDPRLAPTLADKPVVFFTAAVTGFSRCAQDPEGTRRINVSNTAALAKQLLDRGAFVLYLSSNAVFGDRSGCPTEASIREPSSEYGRQKADCEAALLALAEAVSEGAGVAIVRLTKVVHDAGLIGEWLRALAEDRDIEAATDLVLSPVSLRFVTEGLIRIAETRRSGIYHLSGDRALSYYEFAHELAGSLGAGPAKPKPVEVRGGIDVSTTSNAGAMSMEQTSKCIGLAPQPLRSVILDLTHKDAPAA